MIAVKIPINQPALKPHFAPAMPLNNRWTARLWQRKTPR
jgi:hypothetical protein